MPEITSTAANSWPNERDWYWRLPDGSGFSAARGAKIPSDDPGMTAFEAARGFVTTWPRDEAGAQTDAALDAVLWSQGLSVAGPVRLAYGDDLISVLSDGELTAMSSGTLRDQRMLSAQRTPFRATDDIIMRLAAVMKIDPAAWLARLPA